MSYIYPRLPRTDVESEISRLERTIQSGGIARPFQDGAHHPAATFPGEGVPVPASRLRALHDAIGEAVAADTSLRRGDRDRAFDRATGNALAEWFEQEGRQQASHPDVWPYLTLVVLPDFAVQRFGPDSRGKLPADRYRAGRRNVFQRLYLRSWILGDLLNDPDLPIYEDELVGLIDRNLSSDHRLARLVSEQIMSLSRASSRRDIVRTAFKSLQFELRVTDLSAMESEDLRALLANLFAVYVP